MRKSGGVLAVAAVVASMFISSASAFAQSEAATIAQMRAQIDQLQRQVQQLELQNQQKTQAVQATNQQVQELDQKVTVVDHKLAVAQEVSDQRARLTPTIEADKWGFFLQSPDQKAYKIQLGGWVQADGRFYTSQEPANASSTFLLRRVRPYVQGTVDEFYDFRIMEELGNPKANGATSSPVLQDAFGNVRYWKQFQFEIGKFKEALGLEFLQDDRWTLFPERALTNDLLPQREVGGTLHGRLFQDSIDWNLGLFNGGVDGSSSVDSDNNDSKDFIGRVWWRPFHPEEIPILKGFGFGVAGSYGDERGSTIPTFASTFQNTFFTYASTSSSSPFKSKTATSVFASGLRWRIEPQTAYYSGPLGIFGEWINENQNIGGLFPKVGKTHAFYRYDDISNQAWQIAGSYVLTGEDAAFYGVVPRHDFNPLTGDGLGAWEIAARVDQLLIDKNAFNLGFADPTVSAREDLEYDIGLNWYLSRNLKFMLDYVNNSFIWGAPNGHNRPKENGIITRLQLNL